MNDGFPVNSRQTFENAYDDLRDKEFSSLILKTNFEDELILC